MALVLTGKGAITGTVTNVDVNIRYNVDEQGVDSLIETICDRKEDVSECVVYGEGEASFDICSPGTPIAPYTEAILKIITEGFIDPCKAPNPGSPCSFSIAGSFAASLSAGFGASLSFPCNASASIQGRSINGQPGIITCGEVFQDFRIGVEIYSKNILESVAEILRAVCDQKENINVDNNGSIDSCILSSVYPSFKLAAESTISAALDAVADILNNICYGQITGWADGFGCLNVGASATAVGKGAANFACFVASEIANAVEGGLSLTICGETCTFNPCDMAKGLITNCDLACYAFEQLIEKPCFDEFIEKYLEENRCNILEILLPNEASCADNHVIDWFAGALDRVPPEKKCNVFDKFIREDGSAETCISDRILAWLGREEDERPCKIIEAIIGKIGVIEKAKKDDSCVNDHIVDYVDAQTNGLLASIFTNNNNPSKYYGEGATISGNAGYKKNLRNGVLNFVQDETCAIFTALTNGLQGKPTLKDFFDAAIRKDWYAFYFLGQGATADKCVNEFDNFVDAVFCRVARKIVDRAEQNSCPSGDNSDCIIEVARALYRLIIANFAVPVNLTVDGQCTQTKFLADLKSDFVQDKAFCNAPTTDDINYLA